MARRYVRRVSDRTAVLTATVIGAVLFLAVGVAAAGLLGYALEPDPLAPDTGREVVDADRRLGFAQVVAGFFGAVAAGAVGALVAARAGLSHRARRAAIALGALLVGTVWLLEIAPRATVLGAGLVLYAMGAAAGAALAGLRSSTSEP